ncbi:hypothetical protein Tco_1359796 [Tanacetum coccineum]
MHNNIMALVQKERPLNARTRKIFTMESRFLRPICSGHIGKLHSRDGESTESYYSRFYKLMNELTRNNLQVTTMQVNVQFFNKNLTKLVKILTLSKQSKEIATISYHTLFDILKQYQNEVNDIRAERIAKSANPLALLTAAQPYLDNYYQAPKPQRSNATSSLQDLVQLQDTKGKEIRQTQLLLNLRLVSKEDSDPVQARGIRTCKELALLVKYYQKALHTYQQQPSTSSNSRNKTEDTTPGKNNEQSVRGKVGNERTMTVVGVRETEAGSQTVKDYFYHKGKEDVCKQAEHGVPLQAEWLADTR